EEHPIGEVVCCDPGFILARDPDTVRGPDVAVLRHENYPEDDMEHRFVTGAPDLAVEVLSKSDRPGAVAAKTRDYLRAGAACQAARPVARVRRGGGRVFSLLGGKAALTSDTHAIVRRQHTGCSGQSAAPAAQAGVPQPERHVLIF
ncbi:MAG: Uma2 family endonuclease, partial [Pseudomonadota bacterium]